MSSILQTDVLELYNSWGERVAFNEGYKAQKISSAKQAGRDAFNLGLDSDRGKDLYFASRDQRFSEAQEFFSGESAVQIESIEPDEIGDITDGEETLGTESCVSGETEDFDYAEELAEDKMMEAQSYLDEHPPESDLGEYHSYLHETRDVGGDFADYHDWQSGLR